MVIISLVTIGIPREIKAHEYRVSVTPDGVAALKAGGHEVLVENSAGEGSGFEDALYRDAGAEVVGRDEVYCRSDLIVKVKEPLEEEYGLLREGQTLFTFLHLAPNPGLTDLLLRKNIAAFAYETLEDRGGLPLLTPMSEIAGRMSPLVAAYFLQRPMGGSGVLPAGAAGVPPARALVIGAGVVGTNAARVALGLGMRVTVVNRGLERLRELDGLLGGRIDTMSASEESISACLGEADVVVGAVLVKGARAPRCVTRGMLGLMKKGSVVVDVSIDQGGCFETSRPTTHDDPVYEVDGIIHYAVANMPGAFPRTSTLALSNATLPYIVKLASLGAEKAARQDPALRSALNTLRGKITHRGLAESLGRAPEEP
ncbi:MAG: alanine dehydrogenase [Thermodesulfovibrionales bacterium]